MTDEGARHQGPARIVGKHGRDVAEISLLLCVVVNGVVTRRWILNAKIALKEPPREEILGVSVHAAILNVRRESAVTAAIDGDLAPWVGDAGAGLNID